MDFECWYTGGDAVAFCRFCGRAIAQEFVDSAKGKAFFPMATFTNRRDIPNTITVVSPAWCGMCKINISNPEEKPELY